MTLTLDGKTVHKINKTAQLLGKAKAEIVQEAIAKSPKSERCVG